MPVITPGIKQKIQGHLLIAAVFLIGFYLIFVDRNATGSRIASFRADVETNQPELILVGNSLMRAAVSAEEFSDLSHIDTLTATSNGSASMWWYLYVKNVVTQTEHRPRYVGIMFRDSMLTEPAYRVDGSYQRPLRQMMMAEEPLVEKLSYAGQLLGDINSPLSWVPREMRNWLNYKIEKRVEDFLDVRRSQGRQALKEVFAAEKMRQADYNEFQLAYEDFDAPTSYQFAEQLEQSYLPEMIRLLREKEIIPVFIRARRRRDLVEPGEPEHVAQYIVDLRQYLDQQGAVMIDFTHEDRITEAHFGPGDHLSNTNGRELFMNLLNDRLQRRIAELPDADGESVIR